MSRSTARPHVSLPWKGAVNHTRIKHAWCLYLVLEYQGDRTGLCSVQDQEMDLSARRLIAQHAARARKICGADRFPIDVRDDVADDQASTVAPLFLATSVIA
jgi:hypothetical protein